MKVLLVLLVTVAACWADSCDSSFGDFLNALKTELTSSDSQAKALEEESRDDYAKLVSQCFGNDGQCQLSQEELKADPYGDNGALKGCNRCQGLVKGFRDKFMSSNETVRKCFRLKFIQAIREELQPCIQGKLNDFNFQIPEVPDFDEKTFKNINVVEAALDEHIMASSRMDACRSVNPRKFEKTGPCMKNGFTDIYSKHCKAAQNARKSVSSNCDARFKQVKLATAQCMEEKREDWHTRFAKIQDIVNTAADGGITASQCGSQISDVVGAWLNKLQSALTECLPKNSPKDSPSSNQQRDLHTLIELGCGQVINGGVKKNELTVGFAFVRKFLDALNDRLSIFYDKNCSY